MQFTPEPADSPEALDCLKSYFAELQHRFPGGFDPGATISADPIEVTPPNGQFLLVRVDGIARGCGAVKSLGDGIGELKRMWLHPSLRGRGGGKKLLAALEAEALKLEFHTVRLDTSAHLDEALALYRGAGYREIPPYNDNRYAAHWFEKTLGLLWHA